MPPEAASDSEAHPAQEVRSSTPQRPRLPPLTISEFSTSHVVSDTTPTSPLPPSDPPSPSSSERDFWQAPVIPRPPPRIPRNWDQLGSAREFRPARVLFRDWAPLATASKAAQKGAANNPAKRRIQPLLYSFQRNEYHALDTSEVDLFMSRAMEPSKLPPRLSSDSASHQHYPASLRGTHGSRKHDRCVPDHVKTYLLMAHTIQADSSRQSMPQIMDAGNEGCMSPDIRTFHFDHLATTVLQDPLIILLNT
ncbi:hypothetical protein VNI00_019459 [Paramarasmius palmivorus]|uniref:Uncharacterized protein n=1 Tax=Paramarasmius palmivorus TaxID=297713 RepID=A0AAW0ANF4_9AGAR